MSTVKTNYCNKCSTKKRQILIKKARKYLWKILITLIINKSRYYVASNHDKSITKQPPEVFYQEGALKNFPNFKLYAKRDFDTGVSPWMLRN